MKELINDLIRNNQEKIEHLKGFSSVTCIAIEKELESFNKDLIEIRNQPVKELGKWYHSSIAIEKINGAECSEVYTGRGIKKKIIGKIYATHKEFGYNNLKIIVNSPKTLEVLEELKNNADMVNTWTQANRPEEVFYHDMYEKFEKSIKEAKLLIKSIKDGSI